MIIFGRALHLQGATALHGARIMAYAYLASTRALNVPSFGVLEESSRSSPDFATSDFLLTPLVYLAKGMESSMCPSLAGATVLLLLIRLPSQRLLSKVAAAPLLHGSSFDKQVRYANDCLLIGPCQKSEDRMQLTRKQLDRRWSRNQRASARCR